VRKSIAILVAAAGSLALLATFAQAEPAGTSAKASASAKSTVCHRTKSAKNPYRLITVAGASLAKHQRHAVDIVPAPQGGCPTSVMTPNRGGRPLFTTLTGAAEKPGPGDTDGTGTALIRVTPGLGRVCFTLSVGSVSLPAAAAHIHLAPPTDAGPVVVTLAPPDTNGSAQGCVSTTRALVKAILKNPSGYYVNVHTSDFPDGAVRGQLGKRRGPK
jgi:hypothetical protein